MMVPFVSKTCGSVTKPDTISNRPSEGISVRATADPSCHQASGVLTNGQLGLTVSRLLFVE